MGQIWVNERHQIEVWASRSLLPKSGSAKSRSFRYGPVEVTMGQIWVNERHQIELWAGRGHYGPNLVQPKAVASCMGQ